MIRLALGLALILVCSAALAGETAVWAEWGEIDNPSTVTIRATSEPGAVAEIIFRNENVNGPTDDDTFAPVTLGDLVVEISFTWQAREDGADAITARPPEGFFAVPETLVVVEGGSDRILIYPRDFLGM